jgi:hypothetical protein
MFIKNQTFNDEDTLLEAMFDFEVAIIDKDLEANTGYQKYKDSLTDEDDKAELYIEERDLRLAEVFMQRFDSFVIHSAKLYGVKNGERELLYEIDLV